jgi:hypothetical protein
MNQFMSYLISHVGRVGLSGIILVAVGWAAAGTPFRGDQALYAEYARRMSEGAVLYRDLWDVTNPGVFWFYQLAGTCFGFTEDGIHLFEWLYWVAFVLVVSLAVKRAHALPRWPLAPAVLVGGVYYLTSCSDPSQLTKAEGLVAFPLFVSVWLVCVAVERARLSYRWMVAAGVAGGIAVLFKFVFAGCVVGGWLLPLLLAIRRYGLRTTLTRCLGLLLGMAAVAAAAARYFWIHGAWEDVVRTLVVTPWEVVAHAELAGFERLANSVRWFVETDSVILALALAGTFVSLARRFDPMVAALGMVVVSALPVVLVQRWSWWPYHFLLLSVPISVLAAYTGPALMHTVEERIGRPLNRVEWGASGIVGLTLFLSVIGHGGNAFRRLVKHHGGITATDRRNARFDTGRAYHEAASETDWLRESTSKPGPIFVAGDPLFHTLSGRPMATPMHGWSMELFTPGLWSQLFDQLRIAHPVYIFVESGEQHYDRQIAEKCPALRDWLTAEYREVRRSRYGVWYERKLNQD